jgi:hypothetical protein
MVGSVLKEERSYILLKLFSFTDTEFLMKLSLEDLQTLVLMVYSPWKVDDFRGVEKEDLISVIQTAELPFRFSDQIQIKWSVTKILMSFPEEITEEFLKRLGKAQLTTSLLEIGTIAGFNKVKLLRNLETVSEGYRNLFLAASSLNRIIDLVKKELSRVSPNFYKTV